uniref:DIRP domain-containing protein n=1 Tax=Rhabditophanes sp. KR3021 TaxID=114890 RepID=A0AC35UAM1_9BILA
MSHKNTSAKGAKKELPQPSKYNLRGVTNYPEKYKDYVNHEFPVDTSSKDEPVRKRLKSSTVKSDPESVVIEKAVKVPSPVEEIAITNEASSKLRIPRKVTKPAKIGSDLDELPITRCETFCTILPKTQKWLRYEFFYSILEHELYLGDDADFNYLFLKSFPTLGTRMLNLPQWRCIKRLLGKPRRFSAAFLREEMDANEIKRQKLRMINNRNLNILTDNFVHELPHKIPKDLAIGTPVLAKIVKPSEGIEGVFYGKIGEIKENAYTFIFHDDIRKPMTVPDTDIMTESLPELVSTKSVVEAYRASIKTGYKPLSEGSAAIVKDERSDLAKCPPPRVPVAKDVKIGNHPSRMLVNIAKLHKILETKTTIVNQMGELNNESEAAHLGTTEYAPELKIPYAKFCEQLTEVNNLIKSGLKELNDHVSNMNPIPTNEAVFKSHKMPAYLDQLARVHGETKVRHAAILSRGKFKNPKFHNLLVDLNVLMCQLQLYGKAKMNLSDLVTLKDSVDAIKQKVHKDNLDHFENYVEVPFTRFFKMIQRRWYEDHA